MVLHFSPLVVVARRGTPPRVASLNASNRQIAVLSASLLRRDYVVVRWRVVLILVALVEKNEPSSAKISGWWCGRQY